MQSSLVPDMIQRLEVTVAYDRMEDSSMGVPAGRGEG